MRTLPPLFTLWIATTLAACSVDPVTFKELPVTIGGNIAGLDGTGLVLTNNGGDDLAISGNGPFSFPTPMERGTSYAVTVKSQPSNPTQMCSVANASGTPGDVDVTDVQVSCGPPMFTVGGTVSGLAGAGLVLQNNGRDNLAITANGSFTFATPIASGATFAVTVLTQPAGPSQICTVSGGSGTVVVGDVTSVAINCAADRFTVGGTISGLAGTVTLQNNGGDDLNITSNGTFAFSTPLQNGTTFDVTVLTQPTAPSQICTVSASSGTVTGADVTSVVVICATNRFRIGGTVSGLAGSGLMLQNNGGDDLALSANGSFTFPTQVASGQPYAVTIVANPTSPISQTCTVTNGAGIVAGSDITNVQVICTTNRFTIGGTVSGLAGSGLVLQNNGGDDLPITANGPITFTALSTSGATYNITVKTQPSLPTQVCTVTNGTGTVGASNIINVTVTCVTSTFTIGGTVSGLAGSGLVLQNNGGDNLAITANGNFTFPTPIASGAPFSVTVLTQPTSLSQTCAVSGGTGTVGGGNVTSVAVTCTTNRFTVGGTISGLAGAVTLQNNGGDDLTLTSNGAFVFPTPVLSGATYNVTVKTQPTAPSQTCTVSAGSGTVTNANVTNVVVTCTTNRFTIGGTLSGLAAGASITLRNNGGDDLVRSANGSFVFPTKVASGQTYAVTIVANPTSPISQTCTVTNGSGTVAGSDVTNVQVACTTNRFTIGGTVFALAGTGLVLQNNGGNDLAITADGSFTFTTPVASGATYNVTIKTQPSGPACTIAGGTGTVGASNVTNVQVNCGWSPSLFPIPVPGNNNGSGDLALDNNGDLLVVASSLRAIVRVNHATGAQTTVATGIGTGLLFGVAYRATNDTIYASDASSQIFAVTPTGTVTLLTTVVPTSALFAITIAPPSFGSFGGFIIGVTSTGSVIAVNPTNGAVTTITTAAGAVSDLAFAPDGTLYVCGATTVRTVTAAGVVTTFATAFGAADGITITPDGARMFIADSGTDTVRQVTIPGAVVTTFGSADIDNGPGVGGILAAPGNTLIVMTGETSLTLRAFPY